jgi:hypothetical protein
VLISAQSCPWSWLANSPCPATASTVEGAAGEVRIENAFNPEYAVYGLLSPELARSAAQLMLALKI